MDNQRDGALMNSAATPLPIIANVSRLVCKVTDRTSGDRSEFPLLVAAVTAEALRRVGIQSNIFYGQAAWVEIMENMSPMWVGCWGEHSHIWVATEFGEVVDLTVGVSHRKRAHNNPDHKPKYSPPLLWSLEVPAFYKYLPEGLAEVELTEERDKRWFNQCVEEISAKLLTPTQLTMIPEEELDFPEEAMLCPGRKILDDAAKTFQHYDRALMVHGIPDAPDAFL